jgi:uncharacterized protein YuzE
MIDDSLDLKKLVTEPSYFVEEFIGVEPFDYQKEFLDNPANRKLFVAGRRVGKSRSASWKALWYAITHAEAEVLLTAKTQRQSMELFRQIKAEIRQSEAENSEWGIQRETRTEVNFSNGSRIVCLPLGRDGSNIRGYGADLLIVDEAAYVPEEIFQEVLMPFLAVGENQFVMISTPRGKRGFFWDRYDESNRGENQYFVQQVPTWKNPRVDQQWVENQRNNLTPMQFKREIKGQFDENADAYFTEEEVTHEDVAVGHPVQRETDVAYLGVDLAHTGDDESVYISVDQNGNIFDIEYTSNKELTDAMGRIRELDKYNNYDKILIDQTGLGAGVVDQVQEDLGNKVEGMKFTLDRKQSIYSNLKNNFQDQRLTFRFEPNAGEDTNTMKQQLTALEYDYTSSGKLKIFHPSGEHDDFCDALALAVWAKDKKRTALTDKASMQPFNLGSLR